MSWFLSFIPIFASHMPSYKFRFERAAVNKSKLPRSMSQYGTNGQMDALEYMSAPYILETE